MSERIYSAADMLTADALEQIHETGSVRFELIDGSILKIDWPVIELPWPWNRFAELAEKYVGGSARYDVEQIYLEGLRK